MHETYQLILRNDILSRAFKFIISANTSTYAPYHHFHHMMCVTKWCIEGAKHNNIKFATVEWYELALAAMFHDMNHSMGKLSDQENVDEAITMYNNFHKMGIDLDSLISPDSISNIIRATQYPYVINDSDLNIRQAIIRDSDLLVSLEPDFFQNAFLGLKSELNVNDMKSMIQGQRAFHESIEMRTDWAKWLYTHNWKNKVFETISLLEKLYN